MKALAIDLGGTHAKCAVVEGKGILAARRLDLDSAQGLKSVLPLFADTLRALLDETRLSPQDCKGLAFGSCGIVDSSAGRFLSMNQKWEDAPSLDLPAWCRQEFSLPLKLENDARMALLGEWYAGGARGFEDVVMLTLGTGIGGAAMIGGRLLHGKHSQAGNLGGHQPVLFTGRPCNCGGIGCAEAEAAGWSLPLVATEWKDFRQSELAKEKEINFEALFRLAKQGDRVSLEIRNRCLQVWAAAAVGMIHAFDPEVLIFGGGVMKSAEIILPFIQEFVSQHAWTPWGKVQVRAAELGNDAGLLGAIPSLDE